MIDSGLGSLVPFSCYFPSDSVCPRCCHVIDLYGSYLGLACKVRWRQVTSYELKANNSTSDSTALITRINCERQTRMSQMSITATNQQLELAKSVARTGRILHKPEKQMLGIACPWQISDGRRAGPFDWDSEFAGPVDCMWALHAAICHFRAPTGGNLSLVHGRGYLHRHERLYNTVVLRQTFAKRSA